MEDYRVGFYIEDDFLALEKAFPCLVSPGYVACEGSERLRREEYRDLELHKTLVYVLSQENGGPQETNLQEEP